nr:hypothetical protein [Tanacetum cinerariifolium]
LSSSPAALNTWCVFLQVHGSINSKANSYGKEIVITESSVRRYLQLADEEGIDCLPNSTIFEQLALMGKPKRKDTRVPQPSGPTNNVAYEAVNKELVTVWVLDLEKRKTTQGNEINSLKRRIKKLEKRNKSRTHKLKRLYKVGFSARVESFGDKESLGEDASKQEKRINVIDADEDITLVNDDDNEMFDIDDLGSDEIFVARKNDNDDIQAKIDADHYLAERMHAQEHEEMSNAEKAILFKQLLEKRIKHFAAKRAEEKRNRPPTKSQKRKIIAFRRLNTFEDFRPELVKGKGKRAGEKLEQEITKKQKVEDNKEKAKLKQLMESIPNEDEVAIDDIPLAIKSPRIINWKIHKEGKKSYY